jgi:hypothetical protein
LDKVQLYDFLNDINHHSFGNDFSTHIYVFVDFISKRYFYTRFHYLYEKGWAITRTEVTQKKILTIVVSVFLLAYITMFVWENAGVDPASGVYVYDSAPGVILLVERGLGLLWFLWCLKDSYMEVDYRLLDWCSYFRNLTL